MRVDPITELKDIKNIKKLLDDNPRDKLIFVMGVNSGLRVQDLLQLRVDDVKNAEISERVMLRERKTGKDNVFIVNSEIKVALDVYLSSSIFRDDHYLFKSRKGYNYPINTPVVTRLVKKWTSAINIKGNYGAHSLRKTWCYHQRKTFGVSWEVLAKRLNHSTPAITMLYLGIQEEEVEAILLNTI